VPGTDAIARGPLPVTPSQAAALSTGPVVDALYFKAASVLRRVAAAIVDLMLVLPLSAALGLLLCLTMGLPVPRLAELSPDLLLATLLDGGNTGVILLAVAAGLSVAYFCGFHVLRGQTPGKRLLGIMVISAHGERPSVARSLLRTGAYLLSALPVSLGFLWVGFDRERRALHDWLAGTYVVRVP
jgi:uncharacterized RDD family membrane protein YckC